MQIRLGGRYFRRSEKPFQLIAVSRSVDIAKTDELTLQLALWKYATE
jgi:hypothetical protein